MKKPINLLLICALALVSFVPQALFAGKSIGVTLVNKTTNNNVYLQAPSNMQIACLETGSFQDSNLENNVNMSAPAGQSVTGYMEASASLFGGCSNSQSCFDQQLMLDSQPLTMINFLQAPHYSWGVCCANSALCTSSGSEGFNTGSSASTSTSCATCPTNVSIAAATCPSNAPSDSVCYTITVNQPATGPSSAALVATPTTVTTGGVVTIEATVSGGTAPYTITWEDGSTQSGSSPLARVVNPISTTTYSITKIVDANNLSPASLPAGVAVTVGAATTPSKPAHKKAGDKKPSKPASGSGSTTPSSPSTPPAGSGSSTAPTGSGTSTTAHCVCSSDGGKTYGAPRSGITFKDNDCTKPQAQLPPPLSGIATPMNYTCKTSTSGTGGFPFGGIPGFGG